MTTTRELTDWKYQQRCERTVQALSQNGFTAVYCPTAQEAFDYIIQEAADAQCVGFGGSLSIIDMAVADKLEDMGKEILSHQDPTLALEERVRIMRRQLTSDLFLTGTNALTLTGHLVNTDNTGNRAASMFFGPKKVIVVAGRNKLVDGNREEAISRIKASAAPPNARRLRFKTPCAETGLCVDCDSPQRICRVTTIVERKPPFTDIRVLVVNEDMGL